MKIVVIGGTGLIGSKLVTGLGEHGHETVAATPNTGVAGPERFRMDEFFREALAARHDPREVVTDPHARYFGAELGEETLVPGGNAILATTRYSDCPPVRCPGRGSGRVSRPVLAAVAAV
jgi:uncharacterized protein YbjT (DUF2867 family)